MSSLIARLAKAKSRLFGTAPQEIAVPFELACDCGHRVTGIRRTSYQLATCSACQNSVYVLPVNVYPTNRRVKSDVIDGPLVAKVGTVVRDLVMGDTPTTETTTAVTRPAASTKPSVPAYATESPGDSTPPGRKRRRQDAYKREASPSAGQPTVAIAASVAAVAPRATPVAPKSIATRLRRIFSPTRLLALAGIAVLVSTGWWTLHQRQMDQARKNWRTEMDRAEDALKQRDLVMLQDSLIAAVKAAHTLRRTDTDVRIAESLLQQTEAVRKLSSLDLVTLIGASIQDDGRLNDAKATDVCNSLIGQYMVFESGIRIGGLDAQSNEGTSRLDIPLVVHDQAIEILVDSRLLIQANHADPSVPLLFTAMISRCDLPSGARSSWRIVLDGPTCSLVTTEFHASQLGLNPRVTPGISAVVERQARLFRSISSASADAPPGDATAGRKDVP